MKAFKQNILPNIGDLCLHRIGFEPNVYRSFMKNNFPDKVQNFKIFDANYDIIEQKDLLCKNISESVTKTIRLQGLGMSTDELSLLLSASSHLKSINFEGCKLNDYGNVNLTGEFKNLEDLNLSEIQLSDQNIVEIASYFVSCGAINNLKKLNLYHKEKEALLTSLYMELRNYGYRGCFKIGKNYLISLRFCLLSST